MPVTLSPLPQQVRRAFLNDLDTFLTNEPELRDAIVQGSAGIVGLRIYSISPASLRGGARTEAALPVAWRVLAGNATTGVAADVDELPLSGRLGITSAAASPNVVGLITLVKDVVEGNLPQAPHGDYDLRLLRMKSAYLEVGWLKSASGGADVYIPVVSTIKDIARSGTYTADDLFARAQQVAERTVEYQRP